MQRLPLPPGDARGQEDLARFLAGALALVRSEGAPRLVSITVEVEYLDPLAVLESIYEPGELHFYLEHPVSGEAVAAAEAAVTLEAQGPGRFARVRDDWVALLGRTLAVGALERPLAGPCAFGAFTFEENAPAGGPAPFPPARFFVPRWQVARSESGCTATANVWLEPGADPEALAARILRARSRFGAFDYAPPSRATGLRPVPVPDPGGEAAFRAAVERALGAIGRGEFEKIVLSRRLRLSSERPLHPLRVLSQLRERYPSCHAFSVGGGAGLSFIGASPERLLRVERGRIWTEALAGSAPRGSGASEDAALGRELLRSEKNRREHAAVAESIARRLRLAGIEPEMPAHPRLRQLANLQHLHTPIAGALPEGRHALDVLGVLHPTPAVGGKPRDCVVPQLRTYEGYDRGLYAAPIGWMDHEGRADFVVGLRSGLIRGSEAVLHAGVGLVAGSDAQEEWQETELKFQALGDLLS